VREYVVLFRLYILEVVRSVEGCDDKMPNVLGEPFRWQVEGG
jgi:hypothetical protein